MEETVDKESSRLLWKSYLVGKLLYHHSQLGRVSETTPTVRNGSESILGRSVDLPVRDFTMTEVSSLTVLYPKRQR